MIKRGYDAKEIDDFIIYLLMESCEGNCKLVRNQAKHRGDITYRHKGVYFDFYNKDGVRDLSIMGDRHKISQIERMVFGDNNS